MAMLYTLSMQCLFANFHVWLAGGWYPGPNTLSSPRQVMFPGTLFYQESFWVECLNLQIRDCQSWILYQSSCVQNPGSSILEPGLFILDCGSQVVGPESWTQVSGSSILSLVCDIQESGQVSGSWPGFRNLDHGSRILNPGTCDSAYAMMPI